MIKIAEADSKVVSAKDFPGFKGINVLLSRLEENEMLVRKDRGQYSLFHPLFSEYLKDQDPDLG